MSILPHEERLSPQAALLAAITVEDTLAVRGMLRRQAARTQMHPQLAVEARAVLAHCPTDLVHVEVRSGDSKEILAKLDAGDVWTIAQLSADLGSLLPSLGGCLVLFYRGSAVTVETVLADLCEDGVNVFLTAHVVSAVAGTYRTIMRSDCPDAKPTSIRLCLEPDGRVGLEYIQHVTGSEDLGGGFGGRHLDALGTWRFKSPGIVVMLDDGVQRRMKSGYWGQQTPVSLDQRITLLMSHEGQLQVVETQEDSRRCRSSEAIYCPPGIAFDMQA